MQQIELSAYAKINWSLLITGQRDDGYHTLMSLMEQVDLADEITVQKAAFDQIACPPLPEDASNLALAAWLALKKKLNLKDCLRIIIKKNIPLASGLAGGSSDAAAVLRGANDLLDLGQTDEQLAELGLSLGADLPFCLAGGAAVVSGIGERVEKVSDFPQMPLLLINPGQAVSTAAAYRGRMGAFCDRTVAYSKIASLLIARRRLDFAQIAMVWQNDLQKSSIALCPAIAHIKLDLAKAGIPSLMSGSGATVIAPPLDEENLSKLQEKYPFVRTVKTR
ncbi:MAG: 4-(cytidine 5'-diphospho)-2-C-methyl-D-erythritol kinase [Clostridia bacterium]|nr:4-(cytidine 5'-diphospho)-2-C-methyl-D-erythritol kinase [Clostridia bacterium]